MSTRGNIVCDRYEEPENDAEGDCVNCSRHEFEHAVCHHYLAPVSSEGLFDDASCCVRCGRLQEHHHGCDMFVPMDRGCGLHGRCVKCGALSDTHQVCEFFRPERRKRRGKRKTRTRLEQRIDAHPMTESDSSDEDKRYNGSAEEDETPLWSDEEHRCRHCGCAETLHDVCSRFEQHDRCRISSTDSITKFSCDECGRRRSSHHVCVCYKASSSWIGALTETSCVNCGMQVEDHLALGSSIVQMYPHNSSSPVRPGIRCRWYVDGEDAFAAMATYIESALSEIMISAWFLSPELFLRRSDGRGDPTSRFDVLIKRRAEEGVKVYLLLWNETKVAFSFSNSYAKRVLEALHPNIRVILHPGPAGPINWSHHGKCVVIDRTVAFVGGMDLAFGRFDSPKHAVTEEVGGFVWPGKDYYNPRFAEMRESSAPFADLIERARIPRMPWHDVQMSVTGAIALDVAVTFVLRWNHHKEHMEVGSSYPFLIARSRAYPSEIISRSTNRYHHTINNNISDHDEESDDNIYDDAVSEPSRRCSNHNCSSSSVSSSGDDFENGSDFDSKMITPLEALAVIEDGYITAGETLPDEIVESSDHFVTTISSSIDLSFDCCKEFSLNDAVPDDLLSSPSLQALHDENAATCDIQVLKSMAPWSGASTLETSVQTAMCEVILSAEHFIYIENQYFISCCRENGPVSPDSPRNMVGAALVQRIRRAILTRSTFRVVVVLPICPEGSAVDDVTVRAVMDLQYRTINRGHDSLLGLLLREFGNEPDIDLWDYILFCSLRAVGRRASDGALVSEQVYVHSKVLIVDDRIAIIGSANINDRSLIGERDSELALWIRDTKFMAASMNGKPYEVGQFCHSLRTRLWCEHLGLLEDGAAGAQRVADPIHQDTYDLLLSTARDNTDLLEAIFPDMPRSQPHVAALVAAARRRALAREGPHESLSNENVLVAEGDGKELETMRGHLVLFAMDFLAESMNISSVLDWKEKVVVQSIVFH